MMQFLIALAVGAHVTAGEALFKMLEELGVDRHDVFKMAVLGAVLDHEDLDVYKRQTQSNSKRWIWAGWC